MDIWEKMYEEAQKLYNPHEVSDFVYANHVVAAVEAEDGQIFTGFCMEGTCGVFHLCAERAALFNMYQLSLIHILVANNAVYREIYETQKGKEE